MRLTENYHALAYRIRAAKTADDLHKLEKRITRHYEAATISGAELAKLDAMIMARTARLETRHP